MLQLTMTKISETVLVSWCNVKDLLPWQHRATLLECIADYYGIQKEWIELLRLLSNLIHSTGPNRKRSTHNNYASFVQLHVVLLEDYPKEIQTGEVTALELRFYVILPDDATKAPQRETDYVIPRGTLNQILQDDSEVIEAIVRDSVASSITTVESSLNSWKVIAISFVVITAVLISVIAVVAIAVASYKYKQR